MMSQQRTEKLYFKISLFLYVYIVNFDFILWMCVRIKYFSEAKYLLDCRLVADLFCTSFDKQMLTIFECLIFTYIEIIILQLHNT